jgi:CNT family concentrative nucleoside transporter
VTLKLTSAFGIAALIGVAWVLSENRRKFPWRQVLWGVALQFLFGALILKTKGGERVFQWAQELVVKFIGFADEGTGLVFGPLAKQPLMGQSFGPGNAVVLAIVITGTIILISAVSALLYHWGVLQLVVRGMAWVMRRVMGTSGSETLSAAANIFMGQTEAPLVIKPYLAGMTRSELNCMMVGGFATIAGGVAAVYSGVLKVPAGHLLTASVMSAPAALLIAKVLVPETETSETGAGTQAKTEGDHLNAIDALCAGAADGMKLSLNVLAMLVAFTAVVAAANWLLGSALGIVGLTVAQPLQTGLGYLNAPFAWLMGVTGKDCLAVGQVLGERIVLNEFVGYLSLTGMKDKLDERSFTLATYALCGFANLASVGIQIGGISGLAPNRRADLARLGFKAMVGGLLACYLTACVCGVLL